MGKNSTLLEYLTGIAIIAVSANIFMPDSAGISMAYYETPYAWSFAHRIACDNNKVWSYNLQEKSGIANYNSQTRLKTIFATQINVIITLYAVNLWGNSFVHHNTIVYPTYINEYNNVLKNNNSKVNYFYTVA